MPKKLDVLLAGRSKEAIESLSNELRLFARLKVTSRLIENGHVNPVHGVAGRPDVVVFHVSGNGHGDLSALIGEQEPGSPPLIVAADEGDAESMRLAMRAGARDFLTDVSGAAIAETIERMADHIVGATGAGKNLTVFVNAKGGSGATFLACNVAHILHAVSERSTTLLSLDLQFDALPQYFDIRLRHGLMEVLDCVDSLDDVALDAYMTQHESGLRMLAAEPQDIIDSQMERAAQLGTLLDKMTGCYEHVVVDMPRRIDPFVARVFERATRTVLVVQQTLGHLRDAGRMLQIFETYGIAPNQVLAVVNRYDKHSSISLDDIERALPEAEIALVPSDFRIVSESINLGVPMHEHARGSAVLKALLSLETRIGGEAVQVSKGLLSKAFGGILGKDKWFRT